MARDFAEMTRRDALLLHYSIVLRALIEFRRLFAPLTTREIAQHHFIEVL